MVEPELLVPAGDMEKLKFAILYGADAVYLGGKSFGLREKAGNFTLSEMKDAVEFAHQRGVKVYVTVNILAHNNDLKELDQYIKELNKINIDAVIVADPGVFSQVRKIAPELEIHISTQANNTNYASVNFWGEQGAKRVILARELGLKEIKEIRKKTDLELEVFVHGAMCISYSGRCLLSNYLADRDANKGLCANSCRWKYTLMEEKRPGEYYPIEEDEQGIYIFNSKDLNLVEQLPELIKSGIDSFKIEGRMKSINYVATVTKVYREVLDRCIELEAEYKVDAQLKNELKKVSHRGYTTGFYSGPPKGSEQNYSSSGYIRDYDFLGVVKDYNSDTQEAVVEVRNKIWSGDTVEIFGPEVDSFQQELTYIKDDAGEKIDAAPHPHQKIRIKVDKQVEEFSLVRRKKETKGEKELNR